MTPQDTTTETITTPRTTTPIKAIRAKCFECSGESFQEIRLCPIPGCPLWPFRFGKRPKTAAREGYKVDPLVTPQDLDS